MNTPKASVLTLAAVTLLAASQSTLAEGPEETSATVQYSAVSYNTAEIQGLDIFFREAGNPANPSIVLLHGFPTSSHMFRDLIPLLAEDFHVIAPDYPGFGLSSAPPTSEWEYTFDNIASVVDDLLELKQIDNYALYVMDYGAPVGFRIATEHPERVTGFVVQNGNAYDEGLREFWKPIKAYWADPTQENREAINFLLSLDATKWQYLTGVRNPDQISPDNWLVVQPLLDRPGNNDIQLDLFLDYGSNPPLYPQWQQYFRDYQPPMIIAWGRNDVIFPSEGAFPYLQDLPDAELHLLDTGHFALEEDADRIAALITDFMSRLADTAD
jgi:pimeloyl-ACP methyl ester carboxylesterase